METIQTAPPQRNIHRRRPQGFLHTLEGRPRRSGGAGVESLAVVRHLLPVQLGQSSGEGRSKRTGGPARSGAGRTRHPRQRYRDVRRGSRHSGWLPTHMPARPTSCKGWRCVFPLVGSASRPSAPSGTGRKNGRRRTRYCGHIYAIRTLRKVAAVPP